MAISPAGTALTRQHRAAQLALRARTLRLFLPMWAVLDVGNLKRTWPAVEEAGLALIAQQRPFSAALSAAYYQGFRMAEGVSGQAEVQPMPLTDDDEGRARTSLRVTGLRTIQRLEAQNIANPLPNALVRVSGALARHVLDGGRATVLEAVARDRKALGYSRVTSGKPCAFCALLASRGPVYSKERGGFRSHDHCVCSLEPRFSTTAEWPGRGREFRALYDEVARGADDPINAFRRAYEEQAA